MFFNTFNGQTFNSIEPDICKLVYVARVETVSELEGGGLPIPGLYLFSLIFFIML